MLIRLRDKLFIFIVPLFGSINLVIILTKVVLPLPDGPTNALIFCPF